MSYSKFLAYYNLGIIQAKIGKLNLGINSLNAAIKISPKDSYIYIDRALLKDKIGDTSGYCSDLIKASELGAEKITRYLNNSGSWCMEISN